MIRSTIIIITTTTATAIAFVKYLSLEKTNKKIKTNKKGIETFVGRLGSLQDQHKYFVARFNRSRDWRTTERRVM